VGLRTCPDCSKDVSDTNPTCIHCGHIFTGRVHKLDHKVQLDINGPDISGRTSRFMDRFEYWRDGTKLSRSIVLTNILSFLFIFIPVIGGLIPIVMIFLIPFTYKKQLLSEEYDNDRRTKDLKILNTCWWLHFILILMYVLPMVLTILSIMS
jgi:uncharacterized membrane protein YvbJ